MSGWLSGRPPTGTCWHSSARGRSKGAAFKAKLVAVDGGRVAVGKDFDDEGRLKARSAVHLDEAAATGLADSLRSAEFSVRAVENKPYTRRPAAPFTTSTLQQEAARKLRFSARSTMQVAQKLYENGYITYMRTDSPALSDQAVNAARRQASELYGPEYVPDSRRVYRARTRTPRKPTKRSGPPAIRSACPARSAASCPTTSTGSTSWSGSAPWLRR